MKELDNTTVSANDFMVMAIAPLEQRCMKPPSHSGRVVFVPIANVGNQATYLDSIVANGFLSSS